MTNVQPRDDGLWCSDCSSWVPNSANHEMQREGAWSTYHRCSPVTSIHKLETVVACQSIENRFAAIHLEARLLNTALWNAAAQRAINEILRLSAPANGAA